MGGKLAGRYDGGDLPSFATAASSMGGRKFGGLGGGNGPSEPSCCKLSLMHSNGTLAARRPSAVYATGNSCYMNSVLQVLAATGGVREHFLLQSEQETGAAPPPASEEVGSQLLIEAMRGFFWDLHCTGAAEDPVRPVGVLQAVSARHDRYARRAEQDSHEMLRQLLEGLRTEMTDLKKAQTPPKPAAKGKKTEEPRTLIDDLFSGELRSSIVCLSCGCVSCSHEPFLDLSLPIPSKARRAAQLAAANSAEGGGTNADPFDEFKMDSAIEASSVLNLLPSDLRKPHDHMRLGACLQAFGAPEALQGDNAYVCEACEKAAKERGEKPTGQPALKWLQLSSVPRKLTLHLKRFRSTGRRTHKLDEHVPFRALRYRAVYVRGWRACQALFAS